MAIRDIDHRGEGVHVVIDDVLTPEDVLRIGDLNRDLATATDVTVDVRPARTCPAHSLLMLASLRSPSGEPIAIVGLSGPSERMLRYLDVGRRPAARLADEKQS